MHTLNFVTLDPGKRLAEMVAGISVRLCCNSACVALNLIIMVDILPDKLFSLCIHR